MTRVQITQRLGQHQPGAVVDVTDTEAEWIVALNRGTAKGLNAPVQAAAAPGGNGEDPLAGGDPTRRYGHATSKVEHSHNQALPVPGSPVQYNAGVADKPAASSGKPNAPVQSPKASARGRKSDS